MLGKVRRPAERWACCNQIKTIVFRRDTNTLPAHIMLPTTVNCAPESPLSRRNIPRYGISLNSGSEGRREFYDWNCLGFIAGVSVECYHVGYGVESARLVRIHILKIIRQWINEYLDLRRKAEIEKWEYFVRPTTLRNHFSRAEVSISLHTLDALSSHQDCESGESSVESQSSVVSLK